jgi:uncharacterized membrane protein YidH (DUF202 family)
VSISVLPFALSVHVFHQQFAEDIMRLEGALLRKAAGILLIVFGVAAIGLSIVNVSGLISGQTRYNQLSPPDYLYIIAATLAVFFIIGGVFCLKRRDWRLCFTSSILLHILMTLSIFLPWTFLWWFYLIPVWILPLIFICLGKREWSEARAGLDSSTSQSYPR